MRIITSVVLSVVMFALASWDLPTDLPAEGQATYYAQGVMEMVVNNRHLPVCKDCVGYIAMMRAGDVGRVVMLRYKDKDYGPFQVADCAQASDYPILLARNLVAEVDYDLAMKWKMLGPVVVTVLPYHRRHHGESEW